MDYKKLANLLYPDVDKTIEDYQKLYPPRNIEDSMEVCRFAPSPTGRMHMGSLFSAFVSERFAHQFDGIFIIRIEDTDNKRAIEDGINKIITDLNAFNYRIDESPTTNSNYGPYIQSERKNIYRAFAKYLVSIGRAYPCFCSEEE
ncbi:MAG TPA: glutamate--tRNA ligase family protein, partial [Bacilli bacterium]|nr:glutamate--tRNA ligase family protein [Bacilli bacterium]